MSDGARRAALTALVAALTVPAVPCAGSASQGVPGSTGRGPVLRVEAEGGSLVVDVRSPSGIGRGSVAMPTTGWPGPVVVRLHTRGLESLQLRCGDTRLQVEVASHGAHPVRSYRLGTDGQRSVYPGDPLYVRVRAGGSAGQLTVPLREGWFQAEVPPAMLAEGCTPLDLKWIDFYR